MFTFLLGNNSGLISMKKSRKEIALEFANKINSKYIKQIILFGSVARGDDNQDSDIDLLIIVSSRKKVIDLIEDTVADFAYKYQELISAHIISEVELPLLLRSCGFLTLKG